MELLAAALVGLVLYLLVNFLKNRNNRLPPGPFPLPILGNLLDFVGNKDKIIFRVLANLSDKYGDIIFLKLGLTPVLLLNKYGSMKSAFSKDEFCERPDLDWFLKRSFGKRIGIVNGTVEIWKPTRAFTSKHLKEYGFTRRSFLEVFVSREIVHLFSEIDKVIKTEGGHLKPSNDFFGGVTLNILWASIAGYNFDYEDPKFKKMVHFSTKYFDLLQFMGITVAYPFLGKIFKSLDGRDGINKIDEEFTAFLKELIADVRRKGKYQTNPDNFIEYFLQYMEQKKTFTAGDEIIYNEETLLTILYDLFVGGSSPAAAALSWSILWLTMYPEVQEKMRNELLAVLGPNHVPGLGDRGRLPYSRAVLLEILRISAIVPICPRKLYQDVEHENYLIPKNTIVIGNVYGALWDKDYWGDPHQFRPSRFLDQDMNVIGAERVINFGCGKRYCMEDQMAESVVFAILTQLVVTYEFLPAPGHKYDTEPNMGIVMTPKPYATLVRNRATSTGA